MFFVSISIFAQLYVKDTGNVGVNMNNPENITLGMLNTRNQYGMRIEGHGEKDLLIHSYSDTITNHTTTKYGLEICTHLQNNNINNGLRVYPSGSTNYNNYAITGQGGTAPLESAGVCGLLASSNCTNKGAGIYGASTSITNIGSAYGTSQWAGYFRGDVRVTGTVFADVFTPTSNSQSNGMPGFSTNIILSETNADGESVSEKLSGVRLLILSKDSPSDRASDPALASVHTAIENGEELTSEQLSVYQAAVDAGMDDVAVPQKKKADIHYGLAADQLKAVYPELVCEDDKGNVSVNYIEMVPLLVQCVNEQREEIAELREEIAELKGGDTQSASRKRGGIAETASTDSGTDIISLGQNVPNPFTDKTSIKVNVPKSVRSAALFFYDMSGKQIDKIQINDRGKSSISVSGTSLQEGMYLYSLIADGKVIDTRKMILTK
jgi:hypothetical protein